MNATLRKAAIVVGFCVGILSGVVASWFLLPLYIQLLLLAAAQIDKDNAYHCILIILGLIISATPIGFGSTFLMIVASITYGWYAMPMVYFCYLLAGWITFYTALFFIHRRYITIEQIQERLPAYSKNILSLEKAISSHGIMSTCLLQLSAFPFGLACALLPFTKLKRSSFMIGTSISRIKLLAYVYIGISTKDIAALFVRLRTGPDPAELDFQTTLSISTVAFTFVFLIVIGVLSQIQLNKLRNESREGSVASQLIEPVRQRIMVNPSNSIEVPHRIEERSL